jgi:hypothetical protein
MMRMKKLIQIFGVENFRKSLKFDRKGYKLL